MSTGCIHPLMLHTSASESHCWSPWRVSTPIISPTHSFSASDLKLSEMLFFRPHVWQRRIFADGDQSSPSPAPKIRNLPGVSVHIIPPGTLQDSVTWSMGLGFLWIFKTSKINWYQLHIHPTLHISTHGQQECYDVRLQPCINLKGRIPCASYYAHICTWHVKQETLIKELWPAMAKSAQQRCLWHYFPTPCCASHNFACVVHFFCGAHGAWTASAVQEWTCQANHYLMKSEEQIQMHFLMRQNLRNTSKWIRMNKLAMGHCRHCHPTYWKPCIFPRSVDVDVSRHGAFLRAMKAMMPSEASWLLKSCMESSCCESSWWFW